MFGNRLLMVLNVLDSVEAGVIDPLSISEVWLFGASIDKGIISEGATTNKFAIAMNGYAQREHGLNLTFVDHSVGTQTQDQIYNRWLTEKSAITGRSDVLVVTMPMGNTISENRPYANMTPEFLEGVRAQFVAFMRDIADNGNIAMPVNTTFRNYDNNTINNEVLGSLPYNENILIPSIQNLDPTMVYAGRPYLDPYTVTRNMWPDAFADVVHPNYEGYAVLRNFWIDSIAARIKALPPPTVARIPSPDVTPQARVPSRASFYASLARGTGSTGILTASYCIPYTTVNTNIQLPAGNGYALNSLKLTTPSLQYGDNGTALATGDNSDSLTNDEVRRISFFVQTTAWQRFALITGFNPNQDVRVDIVAARSAAGQTNRVGLYSLDGGATYVEASGAATPGIAPVPFSVTGKANAAGELEISWRIKDGSTYAYINGVTIHPL